MSGSASNPSSLEVVSQNRPPLDLLELHQHNSRRYPFLLESVAKGDLGRFDILFAFPQQSQALRTTEDAESFQQVLEQQFQENSIEVNPSVDIPFSGGWFCYFSYDYAQLIEPSLKLPASTLPLAIWVRIPAAVIYDHQTETLHTIAETGFEEYVSEMLQDIEQVEASALKTSSVVVQNSNEETEQKYLSGIDSIKEYILSGDIFQVNLSRQWQLQLKTADYISVYDSLRTHNPAPFAACVDFGDWQILSSSPERLVKHDANWVETRPIAGTRKRSLNAQADQALIDELISHPKEIAEHIMLIDLERNDLGRICEAGTVEVNELMVVESYEHVHHIVSNIRGHLKPFMSPLKIIHATFPGGTITGCPKVRCMEIIAELEQMPREAYTGSLGYINRDGTLDLNILIRTMIHQQGEIRFRAGAGIVADSIPNRELQESRYKAKGLLNVFSMNGFCSE